MNEVDTTVNQTQTSKIYYAAAKYSRCVICGNLIYSPLVKALIDHDLNLRSSTSYVVFSTLQIAIMCNFTTTTSVMTFMEI